jgi:hypothetical protein
MHTSWFIVYLPVLIILGALFSPLDWFLLHLVTLFLWPSFFLIKWCFYSWSQSTLHIKSNLCFVYWVLLCFVFVFVKDMHYNTMIHMFCMMNKMTFTAFHKNMFRSCIMKLKWTNSNVATSLIFDGLLFSTNYFTW